MNLRSIDLNLLSVFDAVFTEGNLTRAAEKIGMSQPAISTAISRFRHIANDELFVRTGRGVKPTPRALEMAIPIRQALALVSVALENHKSFDIATSEREFNLSLGDYGDLVLLPKLVQILESKNSKIKLQTIAASAINLKKEMHFGNVDLHMWIARTEDEELSYHQAGTIREVCVVRADHPTVKDEVSIKEYAALRHLTFKLPSVYGPSIIDRKLWEHGLVRKHFMSVHTFLNVPQILAATDLICSMPTPIANVLTKNHPLRIVKSPIDFELPIFFSWNKKNDNDPAHTWLRNNLFEIQEALCESVA